MKKLILLFLSINFGTILNAQKCYDLNEMMKMTYHPVYEKHLKASRQLNLKVLKNAKTISTYKQQGKLISKNIGQGL